MEDSTPKSFSTPKSTTIKRNIYEVQSPEELQISKERKLSPLINFEETSDSTFLGFPNTNPTHSDTFKSSLDITVRPTSDTTNTSIDNSMSSVNSSIRVIENGYNKHVLKITPGTPPTEEPSRDVGNSILSTFQSPQFKEVLVSSINEALDNKLSTVAFRLDQAESSLCKHADNFDAINSRIEFLEQAARSNNLIISNVKEENPEDLEYKIVSLAFHLGISINNTDIIRTFRLGKFDTSTSKPRLIFVQFWHKRCRDDIYLRRASLKTFSSTPVYVNEDLTSYRAHIFFEARRLCKVNSFFSCWTMNGVVFMKKSKDSPPIKITSMLDLKNKL
jgi:hypothetical protein